MFGRSLGAPVRRLDGRAEQSENRHEPATPPPIAICGRCETTTTCTADRQLPAGWVERRGEAFCADCAPRPRAHPAPTRSVAVKADDRPSRFRGCRISGEVTLGMAAIQIRAGGNPPPGRDSVVQFMLDGHGIDELIIEIAAIRERLRPGAKSS